MFDYAQELLDPLFNATEYIVALSKTDGKLIRLNEIGWETLRIPRSKLGSFNVNNLYLHRDIRRTIIKKLYQNNIVKDLRIHAKSYENSLLYVECNFFRLANGYILAIISNLTEFILKCSEKVA